MSQIPVEKVRREVPSTQRAEKGMTLRKLLKATPPFIVSNSSDVIIKKLNSSASTKAGFPAITAITDCKEKGGRKTHKCSIISLERPDKSVSRSKLNVGGANKRVLVSCNCENFLFQWEYALWTWGASKIKFSNGDPAKFTNPGNVPGMCKHLVAVAKTVIEHKF